MPVNVVVSAEARFRVERARAWLATRDSAQEVLILGASLHSANEIARSMAKVKGAAFGWHRLTVPQLAATIALPQLTELGLASITPVGTEATVTRLVHRLKADGRVGRFAPIAHTPGFPRAIASVMTELRLSRLSPQVVAPVEPDLAALLAAYEAELAAMALTDWPGVLALATEGASAHQFSGLPLLLLDVPVGNEAELVFLRTLAANAPEIFVTVPAADRPTLDRLSDDLGWPVEDLDLQPGPVVVAALVRLQRNLFKKGATPSTGQRETSVEIFPLRAKSANAWRSPGGCWPGLARESLSTRLPSFCAHPRRIAPTSRGPLRGQPFQLISPAVHDARTPRVAHFTLCSNAPWKDCRHTASPSTCRWRKCLTQPQMARRPLRLRAAINGSNPTPTRCSMRK